MNKLGESKLFIREKFSYENLQNPLQITKH